MPRFTSYISTSLPRNFVVAARVLPFALYIAFLAAGPLIAEALPDSDARWLYAWQIGAVLLALLAFRRVYVELRTPLLNWRSAAIALAIGALVFVLWINLDLPWLTLGEAKGYDPTRVDGSLNWALIAVRIFGAAAVVPVMEELFWRSLILRWIERSDFLAISPQAVSLRALLISSVIFGLEHQLWIAGILAGLAYGWLYRKFGSLWLSIFAHAVTNLLLGLWVVQTGSWRFW